MYSYSMITLVNHAIQICKYYINMFDFLCNFPFQHCMLSAVVYNVYCIVCEVDCYSVVYICVCLDGHFYLHIYLWLLVCCWYSLWLCVYVVSVMWSITVTNDPLLISFCRHGVG